MIKARHEARIGRRKAVGQITYRGETEDDPHKGSHTEDTRFGDK